MGPTKNAPHMVCWLNAVFWEGKGFTHTQQCRNKHRFLYCNVCCVQVGAGVEGVSPGGETQGFLIRQQQLINPWGGGLIGRLAL
jgi:hypothetical protein